jgi:2-keto-4-pentenoate hydratase/2-oxohepta-3-ene-1,7-dioic acid hydratase in catechol pathway
MKFLSFTHGGAHKIGTAVGGGVIDLTARTQMSDLGAALRTLGADKLHTIAANSQADFSLEDVKTWRPAVADSSLIACVGLNYEEHRIEAGRARTSQPTIFLRLAASQTGHLQPILVPAEEPQGLDYEAEIAVVIGRGGRRIRPEQAWNHVFGLSCYNDASARQWQAHSTQWAPGKNFPSTGGFGPFVETNTAITQSILTLETRLNGAVLQHADTSMMIFSIPDLISYVSTFTPLSPGDVIVTGTPGGVGFKRVPPIFMRPGDEVEVEVSGIGVLRNPIHADKLDGSE